MRASTLFALTAAVLIGLGIAVAAKYNGYFGKPAEAPRAAEQQILVAATNIFANDLIQASNVKVRNAKPNEIASLKAAGKGDYLPPVQAAAVLRVAKQTIEADTPIRYDALKEFVKPQPLNERLLPDHRAVNIVLPKDRSAGGMVQVGEWVDVYITSVIGGLEGGNGTKTAVIAPKVRVIAKRDNLWPVFAPLPKDKPVEYTLEINSYKAALIEFARGKGSLSMSPLPASEQKKLEDERNAKLARIKNGDGVVESAPEVQEATEEMRAMQPGGDSGGEHVIGDQALVKLFELKATPPPPPLTLTSVERFSGVHKVGEAKFTLEGKPYHGGEGGNGDYGGGNGRSTGVYPPYPYSSNVNLNTGKFLTNNRLAGYGQIQAVGREWMNIGNGGFGSYGGTSGVRFTTPDCPTCGKANKARAAY